MFLIARPSTACSQLLLTPTLSSNICMRRLHRTIQLPPHRRPTLRVKSSSGMQQIQPPGSTPFRAYYHTIYIPISHGWFISVHYQELLRINSQFTDYRIESAFRTANIYFSPRVELALRQIEFSKSTTAPSKVRQPNYSRHFRSFKESMEHQHSGQYHAMGRSLFGLLWVPQMCRVHHYFSQCYLTHPNTQLWGTCL